MGYSHPTPRYRAIFFFDCSGPTEDIWYYEHPLPADRKTYTKTRPLQFDEFAECQKWWGDRTENDRAWKVSVAELLASNCTLDLKNPRSAKPIDHIPPAQLTESILEKEQRIIAIAEEIHTWRPSVIGGELSSLSTGVPRAGFMLLSVIDAVIVT
jgi:hypothetical protein